MNTVRYPRILLFLLAAGLTLGPAWTLRGQDKPSSPEPPATPAAATDKPDKAAPAVAEPVAEKATAADDENAAEKPETAPEVNTPEPDEGGRKHHQHNSRYGDANERINIGGDSTLGENEQAEVVVSIGGSSTSAGEVRDGVVSIFGGSRVTGGSVGDTVVSVVGNTYINGHVRGEVVTILGNVEFGPKAIVDGQVVCVGGQITRDPAAIIRGGTQNVGLVGHHFDFGGLSAWFNQCALYARPLAFDSRLVWAWCVALSFLAVYALIALIAPGGVTKCMETLEQRPGFSLLSALLTLLLTPVAYILLLLTLAIAIGFVLIPLFSLGLFFAAIFGKIVMLAWLGRRIMKLFGGGPQAQPVFGVLIGGIIVLLLYTVPVLGFIVYKVLGILGLGVVVYTLLLQFKASRPPKPAPVMASVAPPPAGGVVPPAVTVEAGAPLPAVVSAATLPRAGFWHRLLASALDAVMVAIAFGMLHRIWGGFGGIFPFWYAVYCVIMWATKGTTIGGIICGLKVVRVDDRPVDWSVAIVRCLSGFLSLAVLGIGFIWVVFDADRQSWHDKIAGTTIVRVPKGTPLV